MQKVDREIVLISVLLALFLVALTLRVPNELFSILPTEEGLIVGVHGWQDGLYGELYSSKNIPVKPSDSESGFELVNDDPQNYKFGYWHTFTEKVIWNYWERTEARIEVGRPYKEHYKDIEYSVDDGTDSEDPYLRVKGEIWVYRLDLDYSIVSREKPDAGIHVFEDVPVWLSFTTNVWNEAIQDENGVMGTAFGAPIAVYIEGYQVADGSGDHAIIEPRNIGRVITLYDEPSSIGSTIDDLGLSVGDIESVLKQDLRPDSRMEPTAFGKWIFSDFGPETTYSWGSITKQKFPAVNYKLKIYYLSIGKWTYTHDEKEEWQDADADLKEYGIWVTAVWLWDGLWGAVGMLNPFRAFGPLGGIMATATLVMIIGTIILILLTMTPMGQMLTSALLSRRRNEE